MTAAPNSDTHAQGVGAESCQAGLSAPQRALALYAILENTAHPPVRLAPRVVPTGRQQRLILHLRGRKRRQDDAQPLCLCLRAAKPYHRGLIEVLPYLIEAP